MVNGFCTGWGELTEMKPEDFNQRSLEWFRFTYLYMLAVCYFNCGWLHVLFLRSLFIIKRNSCFCSLCKVEWILSVFGVCALTLAPNRMWNSDLSAEQHVQNNNINNWNFMYDVHRNKWLNERMNERTNRDRWMKRDRKENHTSKMLKFSYWFQDCRFFFVRLSFLLFHHHNQTWTQIWAHQFDFTHTCDCVCHLRIFESQERAITFRHLSRLEFAFALKHFFSSLRVNFNNSECVCANDEFKNYRIRGGKRWLEMNCLGLDFFYLLAGNVCVCLCALSPENIL